MDNSAKKTIIIGVIGGCGAMSASIAHVLERHNLEIDLVYIAPNMHPEFDRPNELTIGKESAIIQDLIISYPEKSGSERRRERRKNNRIKKQ